jgi:hypothetical protein
MYRESGLPENCLPALNDPRFVVKLVAEAAGKVVQAGFVKLIGEAFVLVDHSHSNPGERLDVLTELVARGLAGASRHVNEVSAWLPPEVEASFGPRLVELGWIKSPWSSYSALLGDDDADSHKNSLANGG